MGARSAMVGWLAVLLLAGAAGAEEFSAEARALPFPPDAEKLQFTAWSEDIQFETPSKWKAVAQFYLDEMAKRGWELDAEETDLDDDSVELTFRVGDLSVEIDINQWSKETRVRMDTDGLDFVGVEDPAKLAAAGVPVPPAVLFFVNGTPLPEGVTKVTHRGEGILVYGKQSVKEAFDYYSGLVKKQGFRESRRPILNDDRRYTEFKKGAVEVSVNVFEHEDGSRSVLEYENLAARVKSLLPEPASLNLSDPNEEPARMEADSVGAGAERAAPQPAATPVNAATNKGQAVVQCGRSYTFKHVACFRTKDRGDYATMVVFASKPIPYNKLQQRLATAGDPSFFELYGDFQSPDYLILQLGEYLSFSFSASGIGIGGHDMEKHTDNLTVANNRITGTFEMAPEEILSRQVSFQATINAAVMTPTTRLSTEIEDPVDATPEDPVLGDSGLPWPADVEDQSRSGSPFRKEYRALTKLPLAEAAEFMLRGMAERGWTQPGGGADPAEYLFKNALQDAKLRLTPSGASTRIEVVVRETAKATAIGLLPEKGKGRLVLANGYASRVVFTIGKTDYPLKAGQGADDPRQGLNYTVPAGAYTVVIKIPGQPVQTERLKIGADETWGLLALPTGGSMPMQMY